MQNYYNDYYQFGVWDGVKNTWNTIRTIPKIASGIGAIKDFGKTGDFNKLVDWGKENFKGTPMIDKAINWAKDNKALLGGLATAGVGAIANHFANKNNQKQVMMGMMPSMGGSMMPMPMMNPYMGMMPMMNPYMGMGMIPGMGGGYYTVTRGNNNGNGFFGNLMQAATPLLAAYGINKWMNGQQKTEEDKKKEEETNAENDIQGRLNKLYATNPNNSNDIKQEYDSLLRSLGDEKGALATLEAKYKGGWFKPEEKKEEVTPQSAADKIENAFGRQRTGFNLMDRYDEQGNDRGGFFKRLGKKAMSIFDPNQQYTSNSREMKMDQELKKAYEAKLSQMTDDVRSKFQAGIASDLNAGRDIRTAVQKHLGRYARNANKYYGTGAGQNQGNTATTQTVSPQGGKKTQAIANATTDSQDPTKNPYADFSYSPLDEIQGRFKDVYFGSWDFLSPETKKKGR